MLKTYIKFRYIITAVFFIFGSYWIWDSRVTTAYPVAEVQHAPQVGFYAPGIALNSLGGIELDLSNFDGAPVVINFWASWCPPCKAEMPDFQLAYQEYQETDLEIISVNSTFQDSLPDLILFVDQNQLTFPVLLDISGTATRSYNIHSLPTTFFIDRSGIIKNVIVGGPLPLSLIRVEINNLLQD